MKPKSYEDTEPGNCANLVLQAGRPVDRNLNIVMSR
jgi:hypothetical protein